MIYNNRDLDVISGNQLNVTTQWDVDERGLVFRSKQGASIYAADPATERLDSESVVCWYPI